MYGLTQTIPRYVNNRGIKEFKNLLFDHLMDFRINPSLVLDRRSQRPRGNQRNWNGQKSNQLGKLILLIVNAADLEIRMQRR
ncbi:hypothetical protein Tco_1568414 [Tanacetum coccineum]